MREEKPSIIKHDILWRVRLLYLCLVLLAIVIVGRLVWVQFMSREVAENAERLHQRIFITETLPAHKGSIRARNGEPLATSIFRYQVSFDFGSDGLDSTELYLQNADSLAILLADFFKDRPAKAYSDLFRKMRREHYQLVNPRDSLRPRPQSFLARWFSAPKYDTLRVYDTVRINRPVDILPRTVDWGEWQVLRKFPLLNWNMGIVYRLDCYDTRIYPKGALARRTVGQYDDRGHQYGIEYAWRDELQGRDGRAVYQRIARRFSGRVAGAEYIEPIDGMDVVTTIDADLQDVADRALRQQMVHQNARWGTTIVMETRTGEILALANCGRGKSGQFAEMDNYALKECIEPGSTFKLATVLTLLDDAHFDPATTYDTGNGEYVTILKDVQVRDSHKGDHVIDLQKAFEASSNVYFSKAVYEHYGSDRNRMAEYGAYLRDHLHLKDAYGLENLDDVPKPRIVQDWATVGDPGGKLARMAYGYRVQLTPMQMLTFYNAVANNGRMVAPMVVRRLERNGQVEKRYDTQVIADRIASDRALKLVRGYLQRVSTHGTASAFFSDTTHLRVAAKTGTARITDPEHFQQYFYLGSLVAFFPAEAPRYTVITSIMTEMQAGKTYYGAGLAGPVTKQLVDYISNRERDWYPVLDSRAKERPDQIKGGEIARVRDVADGVGRKLDSDSRKGWGSVTVDSLAQMHLRALPTSATEMPDVRGMGLRDALFLLESRGLQVRFTGIGAVRQQSPAPGTPIRKRQQVNLSLE